MQLFVVWNPDRQLVSAAGDGKLQEVRELLQEGANINAIDDQGCSALLKSSFKDHFHVVVELLQHDTLDVNHQDSDGDTALIAASMNGYTDIVVKLLKHNKVDHTLQNKNDMTAHSAATIQGHTNIVKCLEEHAQGVQPVTTADSDDGTNHFPSTNNTTKRCYDIFRPFSAIIRKYLPRCMTLESVSNQFLLFKDAVTAIIPEGGRFLQRNSMSEKGCWVTADFSCVRRAFDTLVPARRAREEEWEATDLWGDGCTTGSTTTNDSE